MEGGLSMIGQRSKSETTYFDNLVSQRGRAGFQGQQADGPAGQLAAPLLWQSPGLRHRWCKR